MDKLHPDQDVDDNPDSDDHAEICPPSEMEYIPDDGFCIHDTMRKRGRDYEKRKGERNRQNGIFLSERAVIHMHACIMKQREMAEATEENKSRRPADDYYEGTDTVRGSRKFGERTDNHFSLDVSDSRIRISGSGSGSIWLNGSQVNHSHFILIHLHTPDGRNYGEIAMTYEQFAAAMFSGMDQPCTWMRYWSHNQDNVMLRERVKKPDSIKDRMEKRLRDSLEESDETMREVIDKLQDVAEGRSKLGKRAAADLLATALRAHEHRRSNSSFTVEQALEETTAMVEGAGIYAAILNNVDPDKLKKIGGFNSAAGQPTLEIDNPTGD